jgi:8-oxo-dGTP pyrophosphatase MutT (NUDIX family)
LVRQYRPGIKRVTLCHPGGRIEKGDPSPVHGALRELLEETGLKSDRVRRMGAFAQIPAVETGRVHMYLVDCSSLASDLAGLDTTEDLAIVLRPISELPALVASGEMDCLGCVAASWRLLLMLQGGTLGGGDAGPEGAVVGGGEPR